ncbi:GM23338 [Drosophila sechellia]|uniref:GM23338 n=1 Tax=Drosophila sechellia TaxID=7238 RepID=B4IFA3_DROSE|nr:GM23338 [Drosophila sechellia]
MHLAVHACVRSKKELFHYHFQAHPRQLGCVGGLGLVVVAKCLWRSWFIRSSVGDCRSSPTLAECVPCKCFRCRTLACPDSSQLAGVTALPFSVSLFRTTRRIRDASTVSTNSSCSSFWVNMLCVLSLVECFRSESGPL